MEIVLIRKKNASASVLLLKDLKHALYQKSKARAKESMKHGTIQFRLDDVNSSATVDVLEIETDLILVRHAKNYASIR